MTRNSFKLIFEERGFPQEVHMPVELCPIKSGRNIVRVQEGSPVEINHPSTSTRTS